MNERESSGWFPSAAALSCDILLLWSVFAMMSFSEGGTILRLPSIFLWLGAALPCWALFRLFAARPRTVPALLLAGAVSLGLQLFVLFHWGARVSGAAAVLLALSAAGAAAHGWGLVFFPIRPSQTTLYLEFGALFFVYFLLFQSIWQPEPLQALPIFLTVVLSFLSLVCQRLSGGHRQSRGGRFSGVLSVLWVLLLLGGLSAGFLFFFSRAAGQGLMAVFRALFGAVSAVWNGITGFLLYLISLIPDSKTGGGISPGQAPLWEPPQRAAEEASALPPVVGYLILGAVVFFLIAIALKWLWSIRSVRIGGRRVPAASKVTRSKSRFWHGLGLWLARVLRGLAHRWRSFLLRDTPAGALYWLERHGRFHRLGRGRGETARRYLERLSFVAARQSRSDLAAPLLRLADWLDRACFGSGTFPAALSQRQLRDLRHGMKQVMREEHSRRILSFFHKKEAGA